MSRTHKHRVYAKHHGTHHFIEIYRSGLGIGCTHTAEITCKESGHIESQTFRKRHSDNLQRAIVWAKKRAEELADMLSLDAKHHALTQGVQCFMVKKMVAKVDAEMTGKTSEDDNSFSARCRSIYTLIESLRENMNIRLSEICDELDALHERYAPPKNQIPEQENTDEPT